MELTQTGHQNKCEAGILFRREFAEKKQIFIKYKNNRYPLTTWKEQVFILLTMIFYTKYHRKSTVMKNN